MDDLPYRNNAVAHTFLPQAAEVSSADEREFSTLKQVHSFLNNSLENLYRDFNAFHVDESLPLDEALKVLQRRIDGKKEAYDILAPIVETINSTIEHINQKYRER